MSERQAKIKRKDEETENIHTPGKDKKTIIMRIAAVLVVVAVAGAGVYASRDKLKALYESKTASTQDGQAQQQTQTVADAASEKGITADELLAKVGLDKELTADSSASELFSKLTIDTYAKYEDKTAAEVKEEYGVENLPDDTLWQDAQMKVPMGKIAEMNGKAFADFKSENGLPDEITESTTYEDAMKIFQTQAQENSAAAADGNNTEENKEN